MKNESITITDDEFCAVCARAVDCMMTENPARVLIRNDLTRTCAYIASMLFQEMDRREN